MKQHKTCHKNTAAKNIFFHFYTTREPHNEANTVTFKISPDGKVGELYATTSV